MNYAEKASPQKALRSRIYFEVLVAEVIQQVLEREMEGPFRTATASSFRNTSPRCALS